MCGFNEIKMHSYRKLIQMHKMYIFYKHKLFSKIHNIENVSLTYILLSPILPHRKQKNKTKNKTQFISTTLNQITIRRKLVLNLNVKDSVCFFCIIFTFLCFLKFLLWDLFIFIFYGTIRSISSSSSSSKRIRMKRRRRTFSHNKRI